MAKILIVDDDAGIRQFLRTVLKHQAHQLLEASDGVEGLRLAQTEPLDLIISDILMPTMDGFEFVRRLRLDPTVGHTPVIFHSAAYLLPQIENLADACGVRFVLDKPCKPAKILEVVQEALRCEAGPPPGATEAPARSRDASDTGKLVPKLDQTGLRLQALLDYSIELASQRDPRRLLQNFTRVARDILGAKYALAGLAKEQAQVTCESFSYGIDPESAARLVAFLSQTDTLVPVLRDRRAGRWCTAAGTSRTLNFVPASASSSFSSLLGAPIVSPTRVHGWLCLMDKIGAVEFTEEDERLSVILAALAGRIYESGQLYSQVQRHAAMLEREVAERKRAEQMVAERASIAEMARNSLPRCAASSRVRSGSS